MTLDDRLRRELRRRSQHVVTSGAGADDVMDAARRRTRRARVVGGVATAAFVVVLTGTAIVLRDDPGDQLEAAAEPTPEDLIEPAVPTAGTESGDDAPAEPANPGEGTVAVTEAPEAVAGGSGSEPPAEPAGALDAPVTALVAHADGFVAVRTSETEPTDVSLVFTTDGTTSTVVADPRPGPGATITEVVSHDGTLYVSGDRPVGEATRPWMATTDDLGTWTAIDVPVPVRDDSELTTTSTHVYALAVGDAGILATGETIVDLRIDQLVPADVLESGSWSLGDSSGDVSKLLVYDTRGEVVDEIDLRAAGVSQADLDAWSSGTPTPYVASAALGEALTARPADLPPGTVLLDGIATGTGFAAAGFSQQFSSRILWESANGRAWSGTPVGVVDNEQAQVIGMVGGRLTVLSSQGPVLTVQRRDGDVWQEARLDQLFGDPDDHYLFVDAAFDESGVVAVVATVGPSDATELWFATSADGLAWTVDELADTLATTSPVVEVDGLALSPDRLAIGYRTADARHQVTVLAR